MILGLTTMERRLRRSHFQGEESRPASSLIAEQRNRARFLPFSALRVGMTGHLQDSEGSPQLVLVQVPRENCRDASLRSVQSHVIPAKAGIQFLLDMDPRLRGGDEKDFHFLEWAKGP
jgi:hypothetical protein